MESHKQLNQLYPTICRIKYVEKSILMIDVIATLPVDMRSACAV